MRRLIIFVIAMVAIILSACSKSGADLVVHNNTSNRMWVNFDDNEILINSNESVSKHFSTSEQNMFSGEVEKKVEVGITGETYRIYDYNEQEYVENTKVTLKAGEKEHIYCRSNLACLKIINNSSHDLLTVRYIKTYLSGQAFPTTVSFNEPLGEGDEWFIPVDGQYDRDFYYLVELHFENDLMLTYGDEESTKLEVDEVNTHLITNEHFGRR